MGLRLRLQAPHTSKRQSLSLSKTPIQGVERRGYTQQRRWSKKIMKDLIEDKSCELTLAPPFSQSS